jgi:hypothetical protein
VAGDSQKVALTVPRFKIKNFVLNRLNMPTNRTTQKQAHVRVRLGNATVDIAPDEEGGIAIKGHPSLVENSNLNVYLHEKCFTAGRHEGIVCMWQRR